MFHGYGKYFLNDIKVWLHSLFSLCARTQEDRNLDEMKDVYPIAIFIMHYHCLKCVEDPKNKINGTKENVYIYSLSLSNIQG